jgi:GT2 family glycosyltransferase
MRSVEEMNFEKVWVFIPAYNSASTLESTLRDLPIQLNKIIVVDDGSRDETSAIALQNKVNLIKHEKNKGYGAAQKSGYNFAIEQGAEVVIMLHADFHKGEPVVREKGCFCANMWDIRRGSCHHCGYIHTNGWRVIDGVAVIA